MNKLNRFVSLVVLAAFLLNSAVSDLAIAQPMTDKLAVPLMCDDLVGIGHKDIGRIKLALEAQLTVLERVANAGALSLDPEALKTALGSRIFRENTVFSPSDIQIFFNEMKLTMHGPCVMCRIVDPDMPETVRTYHALFSMKRDSKGGFPITVYTDDEFNRFVEEGAFDFGIMPKRKTEDLKAIDRYVEHERKIDTFIAGKMKDPDNFYEIRASSFEMSQLRHLLFTGPYGIKGLEQALQGYAGLDWFSELLQRQRIVIIKTKKDELPTIEEDVKTIVVHEHTSANGIYLFMEDNKAREIHELCGSNMNDPLGKEPVSALKTASELLTHALAVLLGFPFNVAGFCPELSGSDSSYEIINDLDLAYLACAAALKDPKYVDSLEYRAAIERAGKHFKNKELNWQNEFHAVSYDYNIGTSLLDRDYATGAPQGDLDAILRDVAAGFGGNLLGQLEDPRAEKLLAEDVLFKLGIARNAAIRVEHISGGYTAIVTGASRISVLNPSGEVIIKNRDVFNGYAFSLNGRYLLVRDVNFRATVIDLTAPLTPVIKKDVMDWGSNDVIPPFDLRSEHVRVVDQRLRTTVYTLKTGERFVGNISSLSFPVVIARGDNKIHDTAAFENIAVKNTVSSVTSAPTQPAGLRPATLSPMPELERFAVELETYDRTDDSKVGQKPGNVPAASVMAQPATGEPGVFDISPHAVQSVVDAFKVFFEASIGSAKQKNAVVALERYPEVVYLFAKAIIDKAKNPSEFKNPALSRSVQTAYDKVLIASQGGRGAITIGDLRFNSLKTLMIYMRQRLPSYSPLREKAAGFGMSTSPGPSALLRADKSPMDTSDGRPAARGKSGDDALKTIVSDKSLQVEPFKVTDYLAAYQDAAPVFEFEPLSEKRSDDTARRDIKELIKRGLLQPAEKRGEYELTGKGRERARGLAVYLEPIINKDLMSFIPQEIIEAFENISFKPPKLIEGLKKFVVGVPTEIKPYAERVGLTPAGVRALVSLGITVIVQKGAGREHFSDAEYRAAGARMVDTAAEVWRQADIIKKVKEPLENKELGINELELMRPGQIVFTYLHLASPDCRE